MKQPSEYTVYQDKSRSVSQACSLKWGNIYPPNEHLKYL